MPTPLNPTKCSSSALYLKSCSTYHDLLYSARRNSIWTGPRFKSSKPRMPTNSISSQDGAACTPPTTRLQREAQQLLAIDVEYAHFRPSNLTSLPPSSPMSTTAVAAAAAVAVAVDGPTIIQLPVEVCLVDASGTAVLHSFCNPLVDEDVYVTLIPLSVSQPQSLSSLDVDTSSAGNSTPDSDSNSRSSGGGSSSGDIVTSAPVAGVPGLDPSTPNSRRKVPLKQLVDQGMWRVTAGAFEDAWTDAPPLSEVRKTVETLIAGRPLVGHNLSKDLACLGIDHPEELRRDTMRYAALQGGNGAGRALAELAEKKLGRKIQQDKRHCPREDAVAALDLYLRYVHYDPDLMAYDDLVEYYTSQMLLNSSSDEESG